MNLKLEGKTALVTGAARGIGAEIARRLVEEGCVVYLGDLNFEGARKTARSLGPAARAISMDVRAVPEIQTAVGQIMQERKALDILVNNAGIMRTSNFMESTVEDWNQLLAVNLSGIYYCSKAVLPYMIEKKYGKIVNIASVSAMKGGGAFGNVLYGTTKAGVVAMTKGLGRELSPFGINVNAIAPGVVETDMVRELLTPERRQSIMPRFPAGRLAHVSDVSAVAAFLASEVSAYMTGETIAVDGGFLKT